jgi:hypothetical protein
MKRQIEQLKKALIKETCLGFKFLFGVQKIHFLIKAKWVFAN